MKMIHGVFKGTGAALMLGIGFVPDFVRLYALESTAPILIDWDSGMRAAEQAEGVQITNHDTAQLSRLAYGAGIAAYLGGDQMAADATAYLVRDELNDKRNAGTLGPVNAWTLDTAANRTGHLNAGVNTSEVGEGSLICIRPEPTRQPVWARVLALTNDGDAANEVTLDLAIQSGEVMALSGMIDYVGAKAGDIVPAGFTIHETAAVNASGKRVLFVAGLYD